MLVKVLFYTLGGTITAGVIVDVFSKPFLSAAKIPRIQHM